MARHRPGLVELQRAMEHATTAAEWSDAADAYDAETGGHAWRSEDKSPYYTAAALRSDILTLQLLRKRGDFQALAEALTQSLYKHQTECNEPALYQVAVSGTKHVVDDYLAECETALEWLAALELPEPIRTARQQRFERAWQVFGRSALMLSGGATLGFQHLGVVKALFEQGLLPRILSGTSTGAMIAAGIGTRTDPEIADLFANPDQMRLDGLAFTGLTDARRRGALLDPDQLYAVLLHNIGDSTFADAYARTGRALNISVSAARKRQKPRLLTHLTAPDVLVASAALASSALPALFPPVMLERRDADGRIRPYIDGELWVDGSVDSDLPKLRLARLHNVNHFIVSQTNPHVLPFVAHHGRRGALPAATGILSAAARTQGAWVADLARRATRRGAGTLQLLTRSAYNLVSQDYRGDVDIHPRFHWSTYRKVFANPTRDDLDRFILEGERSVWPLLPRIRNETRIGRAFARCVAGATGHPPHR